MAHRFPRDESVYLAVAEEVLEGRDKWAGLFVTVRLLLRIKVDRRMSWIVPVAGRSNDFVV
jgi:hypothetical protein